VVSIILAVLILAAVYGILSVRALLDAYLAPSLEVPKASEPSELEAGKGGKLDDGERGASFSDEDAAGEDGDDDDDDGFAKIREMVQRLLRLVR
jgi:hypothetical protein